MMKCGTFTELPTTSFQTKSRCWTSAQNSKLAAMLQGLSFYVRSWVVLANYVSLWTKIIMGATRSQRKSPRKL